MHYGISACEELDELFGVNWNVRGLNEAGDFNYVTINTAVLAVPTATIGGVCTRNNWIYG